MLKLLSWTTALLLAWPLNGPKYSGPQCLGPFCIDRKTTARKLFRQLGPPGGKISRWDRYCYASADGHTFLNMETIDEEPDVAAEVFLSDYPNCEHMAKNVTADDLRAWKTREGVGLGSLESDVVRAYGKPTNQWKVDKTNPRYLTFVIKGYRPGDIIPELGDRALTYGGDLMDLRSAIFGLRNGRVCWIWLSMSE